MKPVINPIKKDCFKFLFFRAKNKGISASQAKGHKSNPGKENTNKVAEAIDSNKSLFFIIKFIFILQAELCPYYN